MRAALSLCLFVSCLLVVSALRIQRLGTSEPVFQDIRALVVDPTNIAYVVTYTSPSLLHEVNLNNLRLLRTTTLGANLARSLVLDQQRRRLYIGFDTTPGTILKWNLEAWRPEGNITTFHSPRALAFDSRTNILYAATHPPLPGLTGVVHKINATTLNAYETIELPVGYRARTMVYDSSRYYLYVGNELSPPTVTRIWAEPTLQRMDVITFPKSWEATSAAVIDSNNQFAYFGISNPVARVAKINLANFQWVDTLSTATIGGFSTAGIDNLRGYSYWVTNEMPSALFRIRTCDFSLLDVEAFTPNDLAVKALAVRELTGVITVGTSCLMEGSCMTSNSLIKLQVTSAAVCPAKPATPPPKNTYQNTVNFRFAGMIPSPSCCPPPQFFTQPPRVSEFCNK